MRNVNELEKQIGLVSRCENTDNNRKLRKKQSQETAAFWPHLCSCYLLRILRSSDSPPPHLRFSARPFIVLRLSGPSIVLSSLSLFAAPLFHAVTREFKLKCSQHKSLAQKERATGVEKERAKPRRVIRLH